MNKRGRIRKGNHFHNFLNSRDRIWCVPGKGWADEETEKEKSTKAMGVSLYRSQELSEGNYVQMEARCWFS